MWRVRYFNHNRVPKFALPILVATLVLFGYYGDWFVAAKKVVVRSDPGLYSVAYFVDGDTLAVKMNGKVEKVRFIGVDTPETKKPNSPVQCYGHEASDFTKTLVGNQKVRLVSDPQSTDRDRYDRLLRYVYLPDGRMVEEETIKNGYGFAYVQFPFTKSDEFSGLQARAKSTSKGLWGKCQPYQESSGRWQTEDLPDAPT